MKSHMNPCVLHVAATNFFGGPEKQILNHCIFMAKAGWRMVVCSFLDGMPRNDLLNKAADAGLRTGIVRTPSPYNPRALIEYQGLIQENEPDIIVVHGYRPLIYSILLKKFHRWPIIAVSRGYTAEDFKVRVFERLHR